MPENPKVNQDTQTSQITNEPDSWSSPKTQDGYARFGIDDLYPERVERLKNYLSDSTRGDMSNLDVQGGQKNRYPIDIGDGENPSVYLKDNLDSAKNYFEQISNAAAFFDRIIPEDGHTYLTKDARDVVDQAMTQTERTSRWAGIGQAAFKERDGTPSPWESRWKFQGLQPGLATSDRTDFADPDSKGSKFNRYTHLTGQPAGGINWDEYYLRAAQVGSKITLGAQGFEDPEDTKGNASILGYPTNLYFTEDSLQKPGYRKVNHDMYDPQSIYLDFSDSDWENKEATEAVTLNKKSYGQMNSSYDPFYQPSWVPILSHPTGRGMELAIQLTEIWLAVQGRILIIANLLQTANWFISLIESIFTKYPSWNNNYYPAKPQTKNPTNYEKGYSGNNHPSITGVGKAMDVVNRAGRAHWTVLLIAQVLGPVVNQAATITEEQILGTLTQIVSEINFYIPRHIISTTKNSINMYGKGILGSVVQGVDLATAYTRAVAAGMGQFLASITLGDNGKSIGFYKNLHRALIRSKLNENVTKPSVNQLLFSWVDMMKYFGQDDKFMSFINMLATIGDIGTASGYAGQLAFPENKVPLQEVVAVPTLRTAKTRIGKSNKSTLSLTNTPSMMVLPKSIDRIISNLAIQGLGKSTGAFQDLYPGNPAANHNEPGLSRFNPTPLEIGDDELRKKYLVNNKFQPVTRFSPEQVQAIENQLEAEHVPFYIQDLRTNEIISFHAFLTGLTDSYTANWSAEQGFGRLEAAQIYGGGSRSISCNFQMISMNEADFQEMWIKINKLTTLVYPQWSQGTMMQDSDGNRFVQPFSQVPTASPLCRIRVGDLFTSNYSELAMARMMGIGDQKFKYDQQPPEPVEPGKDLSPSEAAELKRYPTKEFLLDTYHDDSEALKKIEEGNLKIFQAYFISDMNDDGNELTGTFVINPSPLEFPGKSKRWEETATLSQFLDYTIIDHEAPTLLSFGAANPTGLQPLFDPTKNPIFKAFRSTMGRGIAVAITGIGFDWKLGEIPWELKPGHRAPRACEVSLSMTPIHDITPGLDHEGFNRAPIYGVGGMSKLKGDPWLSQEEYDKLTTQIEVGHQNALRGKLSFKVEDKE